MAARVNQRPARTDLVAREWGRIDPHHRLRPKLGTGAAVEKVNITVGEADPERRRLTQDVIKRAALAPLRSSIARTAANVHDR